MTYIAFADGEVAAEDGNGKLTVRKYESGVWTTVGPAMFTSGPIKWPSIACDSSGTPYVAYRDDSVGEGVTVKKFNGTSWVQVGSGMIAETVRRISIGIGSDNLPAVVYYNESW